MLAEFRLRFFVQGTGRSQFINGARAFGSNGWEVGTVRCDRLFVDGIQVVGARTDAVADPAGGSTIDAEAREAITVILATLRHHGLIAT